MAAIRPIFVQLASCRVMVWNFGKPKNGHKNLLYFYRSVLSLSLELKRVEVLDPGEASMQTSKSKKNP